MPGGSPKKQPNGTGVVVKGFESEADSTPPDGGSRAWLVMVGSFFCNGILFGVINTYSVLYAEIYENLTARNVSGASSKAALVGSLAMGTTFMVSPVAGVLTDAIGIRKTAIVGGTIASGGMFLSSFYPYNVYSLYVTYGVMYGLGCALTYTPSLAILGHYFKRYIGIVNGIVTCGSSVFTILLPHLIDWLLKTTGIAWTLRIIAIMSSGIIASAMLFKPVQRKTVKTQIKFSNIIDVDLLRNKKFLIWTIVLPLSLFGYFVPYVHMMKFVEDNYTADSDGKWPVICIGLTSGIGRIIFGYISDFPRMNRIIMQQVAFLVIGVCTCLLPATSGNFPLLILMTLLMGLFDGCFIALLGPVAFDICGHKHATQAISMLLGLCSIPLTLGPYVAGILYSQNQSYHLAFRLAGIPPILGAFALFLMRFNFSEKPEKAHPNPNGLIKLDAKNGNHVVNGVNSHLASTGRLFPKETMSVCVLIGKEREKQRCYSYSIL